MLMTVATTVLGLMPLLWEAGVGADLSARTAAPVVGGLWSCMFLTLLVLPAYAIWRRWNSATHALPRQRWHNSGDLACLRASLMPFEYSPQRRQDLLAERATMPCFQIELRAVLEICLERRSQLPGEILARYDQVHFVVEPE